MNPKRRAAPFIAVGALTAALSVPALASAKTLPGGTVPVVYASGALVRVSVDGHPLVFEVDTGASTSAITAGAAQTLGLAASGPAQTVSTVGCSTSVSYAPVTSWRAGNVSLPATQVAILHSSLSTKGSRGPTISGLLGSDVLSQFGRVTFDLAGRRLILGGRPVGAHAGIPMTVSRKGSAVVETVRAEINGHASRLVVDTGSPLDILQSSAARHLGLKSLGRPLKVHGAAGCSTTGRFTAIPQWTAGGEPLPTAVAFASGGLGLGFSSNKNAPVGLIGAATLFDFGRLEIDFARGRIVFGSPS